MLKLCRRPSVWMALAVSAVLTLPLGAAGAAPVAGRAKVVAVDKRTGRAAWEAPLWSRPEAAVPPLVTPERIYVSENGQVLKALDAATGKLHWQAPAVTTIPPALAGELVISVTGDAARAFNRWTGKKVWEYKASTFPEWKFDQNTVPVIAGNRVLLPAGYTVIAVDQATGQPAWAHTLSAAKLPLQPAVVGEMVYLRSERDGHEIEVALKLEDGLPDTGEYSLPPDIARAIKRDRKSRLAKQVPAARPAKAAAAKPFIAVQAKVTPGGGAIAAAGARRWSFKAPAGWTIDRLAGEAPGHLYALLAAPAAKAPGTAPKAPTP